MSLVNVALGRCRIEGQCKVGTRSNYRQTALEFISIVARPHTNIYYSLSYPQRIFLQVRIMFSIYVGIKVSLATALVAECNNGTRRVSTTINTEYPQGTIIWGSCVGTSKSEKSLLTVSITNTDQHNLILELFQHQFYNGTIVTVFKSPVTRKI